MANGAFQPILNQASGVQAPQGAVQRSIDLSPLGQLVGNTVKDKQRSQQKQRQQTQEIATAVDTAGLQTDLIALQSERAKGNLLEQKIDQNLAQLRNDGIADEEQIEDFQRVRGKLEDLKQFRNQGVGNDNVFQLRKNALFTQAIQRNPLLYDEINTLFNGDISDPSSSAQSTAQAQIQTELTQRHGPGFGLAEWENFKREQAIVQNFEQREALGVLDVANMSREVPLLVSTSMKGWVDRLRTTVKNKGGVDNIEELPDFEAELENKRIKAYERLNNLVERSQQEGRVVDAGQISALRKQVDEEFSFYQGMLEGKDLLSRAETSQKLIEHAYRVEAPPLIRHMSMMGGGEGGSANMDTLLALVNNPELQQTMVESGYFPQFEGATNGQITEAVAESLAFMLEGREVQGSSHQALQDSLSAIITKQAPAGPENIQEPVADNFVDMVERRSRDENGNYNTMNIADQWDVLLDKAVSKNVGKGYNKQQKDSITVSTRNQLSYAMAKTAQDLDVVAGSFDINYSEQRDAFVVENLGPTSGQMARRGMQGQPSGANKELQEDVALLNKALDLADNPNLQGVVFSKDNVLNKFNEVKQKVQESQQEEDTQETDTTGTGGRTGRVQRQEKAGGFDIDAGDVGEAFQLEGDPVDTSRRRQNR